MNYYTESELVTRVIFMERHLMAIEQDIDKLVELQRVNNAKLEELVKALNKEET